MLTEDVRKEDILVNDSQGEIYQHNTNNKKNKTMKYVHINHLNKYSFTI